MISYLFYLVRKSHIFDGKTITKETAAFQLCDIHDPMLKSMIEDPDGLRDVCHVRLKYHKSSDSLMLQ
jgi:general transcription factor 3C polypeptide 5 (transcription factor C subunit 1)